MNQKWIALLLALILALSVCGCAADKPQTETAETTASVETQTAAGQGTVTDEELTQTAQWLMEQIPQPTYGSVGASGPYSGWRAPALRYRRNILKFMAKTWLPTRRNTAACSTRKSTRSIPV